jgi:hypothetical protein
VSDFEDERMTEAEELALRHADTIDDDEDPNDEDIFHAEISDDDKMF